MTSRHRGTLFVILAVYLLNHLAQLAITPLGEGMDFFGHLSYIVFYSEKGRAPTPDEPSKPSWIARLQQLLPAPDASADGRKYRAWADLSAGARRERRAAALAIPNENEYVAANYEAQHPPFYYWLASRLYRALSPRWDLSQRVFALCALSECLVAVGLLAVCLTFRLYLDERASLLGLLAVVWYPNLLGFFGRLTNDTLAFALIAWAIYLSCLSQRRGSMLSLVGAGVLIVLAAFTKTYALTLVPVYLACAFWTGARPSGRRLAVAGAITGSGIGWLLRQNLLRTGHLIPLIEMRLSHAVPVAERLRAVARVDPAWFVGGLVKGFWWSGYWSFVSPGAFYYIPLAFAAYLLVKRPVDASPDSRFFSIPRLWPHYGAIAFFTAGMLWHAATFRLYAELGGAGVRRGNEGWYANVLLGSFFVAGLVLLEKRVLLARFHRVLASVAVFFIVWNLVARIALVAFWIGRAEKPRGFGLEQLRGGEGAAASLWSDLRSLPGVIPPLSLTLALPLLISLLASTLVIARLLGGAREPRAQILP
jgi:hypothetical protein